MSAVVELPPDVGALTVDDWVDHDPPLELVLRRERDGVEMRFCPTRESYQEAIKAGVIAFTPAEVAAILTAAGEAGDDQEKRTALVALLDRAVVVKQSIPGAKVSRLLGMSEEKA